LALRGICQNQHFRIFYKYDSGRVVVFVDKFKKIPARSKYIKYMNDDGSDILDSSTVLTEFVCSGFVLDNVLQRETVATKVCNYCRKNGHFKKECPVLSKKNNSIRKCRNCGGVNSCLNGCVNLANIKQGIFPKSNFNFVEASSIQSNLFSRVNKRSRIDFDKSNFLQLPYSVNDRSRSRGNSKSSNQCVSTGFNFGGSNLNIEANVPTSNKFGVLNGLNGHFPKLDDQPKNLVS